MYELQERSKERKIMLPFFEFAFGYEVVYKEREKAAATKNNLLNTLGSVNLESNMKGDSRV